MTTSVRYQIIEEIGRGAMGIVYLGKDPKINRDVALKCLRPHILEAHESAGKRFQQEILALGRLIHPNIVTIFDVWEDPASNNTYIVMEYVEGTSLAQLIKEKSPFSAEEVVYIGVEICKGLHFAHSKEVVHRDIKPANVLLSEDLSTVKITDFGIARLDSIGLTQSDHLAGTPQYMSPEQCRGETLSGRSDLFAVGALLYEMLTYQKAFQGDSVTGIMHKILTHTPYPPYLVSDDASEALSAVVMQALEKDADKRFSSGFAMADALRVSLEETAVDTDPSFQSTPSISSSHSMTEKIEHIGETAETRAAPLSPETLDTPERPVASETRIPRIEKKARGRRLPLMLLPIALLVVIGILYTLQLTPNTPLKGPSDPKSAGSAPQDKNRQPQSKPTAAPIPRMREKIDIKPQVLFGQVIFATSPSGADILINGINKGKSPVTLDLPAGSHDLLVSKKGYHALEATIDVPSGEKTPVTLKLLEENTP